MKTLSKYHFILILLSSWIPASVFAQIDSLQLDSTLLDQGVTIIEDKSLEEETSEGAIDSPINYDALDSFAVSMQGENQIMHLYGDAKIEYGSIKLDAAYIRIDIQRKEIFASGLKDSLGNVTGKPHFMEGDQQFDCDTLRYNFDTGKGYTVNVVTEQQDGLVRSAKAKMMDKDNYCMVDGKYSTCTAEHPHFYLAMTKGKVVKDKAIITGRAYLVLEDFPIYFPFLPYGFIPTNKTTYTSGVIIPSYGSSDLYGYYLRDGGFYWAASDYFDIKLTSDVYSKGKWAMNFASRYKLRYKFGGSLSFGYSVNSTGERGINQSRSPNFSIRWNHSQDAKANPSQSFSASVDFSSSGFSRENEFDDPNRLISNSKSSSVNYQKTFQNTPFSLNASITASQNTRDSTVSLTLPSLNVNMKSFYPLKRKNRVGSKRFYEDLKLSYNVKFQSNIRTKEYLLLSTPYSDWEKGLNHNLPITLPSFKLFNHINLVPSISYKERWYFDYLEKYWVDGYQVIDNETGLKKWVNGYVEEVRKDGFRRNYEYGYSLSASTTLYGMYTMLNPNRKLVAIRHKIDPTFSFNYRPDFSQDRFGFYDFVQIDSLGNIQQYNQFQGAMYGSAGAGESGSVSFGLNNNIEMKLVNDKDSTSKEKYRKVAIFDNLGFSGSYNIPADSMNFSTISLRARTKIAGTVLNVNGTLDPYMLSDRGRRINEFTWNNANGIARLGRLTRVSTGFGWSYNSDKFKNLIEGRKEEEGQKSQQEGQATRAEPASVYQPFDMPWRLSANYTFNYTNSNGTPRLIQSVSVNGGIDLTPKWETTFSTGYDLVALQMTHTKFSVVRNLHCWTMSFDFSPFGKSKYYMFSLRANASMLKDLKLEKNDRPY